jgi:hypothetical protein
LEVRRARTTRDRVAWLIALAALGVVVYFFVPLWVLAAAVLVLVTLPILVRHNRRHARR